jgi:hypothetical protein
MDDRIDQLERDTELIGKLARHFDQLGLARGTEVLLSVERELQALANERRVAAATLREATADIEALKTEVRLLRETIADLPVVLRTWRPR